MRIRGVIRTGTLEEDPLDPEQIELALRLQGVGRDQPRSVVIPFSLLLADPTIDPEAVAGRGFEAEVSQAADGRWLVSEIAFASRVLRAQE